MDKNSFYWPFAVKDLYSFIKEEKSNSGIYREAKTVE